MAKLLEQLTNIWTARVLVMVGLLAGYVPISSTFDHIGDVDSLLTETSFLHPTATTTSSVKAWATSQPVW